MLLGGLSLMLFGAGLVMTNPTVRCYLGQASIGGVGDLVQMALPDLERYLFRSHQRQPDPARPDAVDRHGPKVAIQGDMLRAFGQFPLWQSDLHIHLIAIGGGTLKLKDELTLRFDVVARRFREEA